MTRTNNDPALRVIERAFGAIASLCEREHAGDFSDASRENVRELVESAYLSKPETREARRALARLVIACDLETLTVCDLKKIEEIGLSLISYPPIEGPAAP